MDFPNKFEFDFWKKSFKKESELGGKFRKVTEPFYALISLRKLCFCISCHILRSTCSKQQKSAMLVKISFLRRPCCVDIENNIYLLGTIVVAQKLFNCRWGKRERER